jgi:4-amino-4-deoxy-L-arabinose transferase-like glycosyltransferase
MTDSKAAETPAEIPAVAAPAGPTPPRWLTALARHPFALLGLLGLLLWLPGALSLPALDRDESRFAQSSRQMVESGDVVDLRFGQVPRYKKPAGIYWLQAAATEVAGLFSGHDDRIWTYRLPSLLGGIGAGWLTFWCALAVAEVEAALLAAVLMMGTVLLTAEATIATTDAVLLACVLAVQGVLLRLYRAARDSDAPPVSDRTVMWGWAAFSFGILVKGPVVLGVASATIIGLGGWDTWRKRKSGEPAWAWLNGVRLVRGLPLVLLIILPWLIAITIQSRGAFFEQSLGGDFAAKMAGGQESHGGWPGYYLLASALSFWPAILFVAPGIMLGIARRAEPGIRFLLVWAGVWWLAVEAVPTKLPHYVLEAYPALAILAALFLLDPRPVRFLAAARWVGIVQFGVGAVLLTAGVVLLPIYFGQGVWWWPLLAAAGVGALLALAALVLALMRKNLAAALLGLLALLVFAPALTVGVGPRLDQFWISQRLKPMVAAASRPSDSPPALAGYEEPSLVFALGKDVVLTDGRGAADATVHGGGLALVEDGEQGAFFARLAELQADAATVGDLSGINYSRGRKVHVTLYRVAQVRELN